MKFKTTTLATLALSSLLSIASSQTDAPLGLSDPFSDDHPAESSADLLKIFEFPGGTFQEFAETLEDRFSEEFNVIVKESARSLKVPSFRIRKVSADIILETAAELIGATTRRLSSGNSGHIPVYIVSVARDETVSQGSTTNKRIQGASRLAEPAKPKLQEPSVFPMLPPPASSGLVIRSSPTNYATPQLVTTKRIVEPMFFGHILPELEGRKGLETRLIHLDDLEHQVNKYFPDSKTNLSAHTSTKTVVVQSNDKDAVDFVRSWLEIQKEASRHSMVVPARAVPSPVPDSTPQNTDSPFSE